MNWLSKYLKLKEEVLEMSCEFFLCKFIKMSNVIKAIDFFVNFLVSVDRMSIELAVDEFVSD